MSQCDLQVPNTNRVITLSTHLVEILKYQKGNSGMKVICLDHDEMMPMSKNPVSEAMKHLHGQLCEMSLKALVAKEWVK